MELRNHSHKGSRLSHLWPPAPTCWSSRRSCCASGRCRQRTRRGIHQIEDSYAIDTLGVKLWAQSFLNLAVHFLVQVADGQCAYPRFPQEFRHVLHAAHGYVRQVHLYERLLHGRFPAFVAFYDGYLERGQAQFRDSDIEFSRSREQFPVVVPAAVVLAAFGALVPFGITETCRLLVQHRVECVLDCASDERFQVVPKAGFVNWPAHPLEEFAKENIRYPFNSIGCIYQYTDHQDCGCARTGFPEVIKSVLF